MPGDSKAEGMGRFNHENGYNGILRAFLSWIRIGCILNNLATGCPDRLWDVHRLRKFGKQTPSSRVFSHIENAASFSDESFSWLLMVA
jgi:hypothetical protein